MIFKIDTKYDQMNQRIVRSSIDFCWVMFQLSGNLLFGPIFRAWSGLHEFSVFNSHRLQRRVKGWLWELSIWGVSMIIERLYSYRSYSEASDFPRHYLGASWNSGPNFTPLAFCSGMTKFGILSISDLARIGISSLWITSTRWEKIFYIERFDNQMNLLIQNKFDFFIMSLRTISYKNKLLVEEYCSLRII